ncbi:MAG: SpaA isopeptide-forming pilin-related protein [Clostridium sp.]|nr:SpaA isopeptide-forming pilin-related protein [Clostridium sp.]
MDAAGNIVISKTDNEHFLTYVITAKAPKGKSLADMTIKDLVPAGLAVSEVKLNDVGEALTRDTDYTIKTESGRDSLEYKIPADYTDDTITLTVTTVLTEENYREYINIKNGKPIVEFKNKAELHGKESTDPTYTSGEITAKLTGQFMNKEGERVGLNSPYWDWTITANTYFTGDDGRVYLIDSIQGISTTHMYAKNAGGDVEFFVNDAASPRKAVEASSFPEDKTYSYANLLGKEPPTGSGSVLTSAEKKEWLDDMTGDGTDPVYYTNGNEAVLIIPLDVSELNKPLKVTYQTKAIDTIGNEAVNKTLKNEATMLWYGVYGPGGPGTGGSGGGGEIPEFSFNIDKNVNMNYDFLQKTAGNLDSEWNTKDYNPKTRTMTWTFEVNYSNKDITDAVVKDYLRNDVQKFKTLIAVKKTEAEPDGTSVEIPEGGTSEPNYTLTSIDAADLEHPNTTLLTINLGDIEADEVYVLTLKTTVVDPNILNNNNLNPTEKQNLIENSATFTGTVDGVSKSQEDKDQKNLPNTILVKENIDPSGTVKNYYDFAGNRLYWRVRINQNHANIAAGAILTDTVPTHTTFEQLVSIKQIPRNPDGSEGTATTQTVNKSVPSDGSEESISIGSQTVKMKNDGFDTSDAENPRQKVQFKFESAFYDTYELVFTTKVDDTYRTTMGKNLNTAYLFKNDSNLTGEVVNPVGSNVEIKENTSATHTVRVPAVGKQGQYDKMDGSEVVPRVKWQILLNAGGVDMEGAKLEDTLKECFQLDQTTLSIKEVDPSSISEKGPIIFEADPKAMKEYTTTGGELKSVFSPTVKNSGFSFTIPNTYAKTPLLVTFTTLVVAPVKPEDMTNKVTLTWRNGDTTNTNDQKPHDAAEVTWSDFANASTRAQLRVLKTSSNSTGLDTNAPDFRLPGAEFTLTPMKYEAGKWVADGETLTKKTASNGMIYFLYLEKDRVYQLKETVTPEGYKKESKEGYYIFPSKTDDSTLPVNLPEKINKIYFGNYAKNTVIVNAPQKADANTYSFSFTKQSDDGNPALGATFTLTKAGLQTKQVNSDKDGSVKFENLDPGSYTLKETTAPGGFRLLSASVTVTISTTGDLTVSPADGFLQKSVDDGYIVSNTRIRGTVTLQKQDSVDASAVTGAKFTVYSKTEKDDKGQDKAVAYLIESSTTPGLYELSDLDTPAKNAAGDLYFKTDGLMAGDYTLKETTTPKSYQPDVDPADPKKPLRSHDFSITTNGQVVQISNNGSDVFTNVPVGSIVGQKVIASSGLPLAGATIGLFNAAETNLIKDKAIATVLSENDGSFTFSNLLYGTYKIAEVAAPGRYLVNTSAVFTVTVNQNKQSITTDDSGNAILIANARRSSGGGGGGGGGGNPGGGSDEGYIVIQKSSEDGVLSGFTFEITDGNAYTERFVTDADGRIMTGELPKGTYTVREIAEEGVTDRYELPKAQTVRISGVGTKLNFENKLLPEFIPPDEVPLGGGGGTEPSSPVEEIPDNDVPKGTVETFGPKTGYTGASPLWALMLGLSLAGLGYSVISLLVSRKKGRHVDK